MRYLGRCVSEAVVTCMARPAAFIAAGNGRLFGFCRRLGGFVVC